MPAADCPACGFNFRLGRNPAPAASRGTEAAGGRNRLALIAGAAAFIAVAAAIIFFASRPEEPAVVPPPAASGHLMPSTEELLVQSPTLHPAVPINRAKDLADKAESRVEEMENIDREFGQQ
jgi:hypothetical protein